MTPVEKLLEWLSDNHYYIGNDLLEKVEELKQMEKLKNHSEYMSGWYNGFNMGEIETSNMEKTAVEWLVNELKESIGLKDMHAIEKARQMFEQQIRNAWNSAYGGDSNYTAKQYYKETFKSE